MSNVTSNIDIYESERPKLDAVIARLSEKVGTHQDAEGYRREIIDRFADIGFKVSIKVLMPAETCPSCGGVGKMLGLPCLPCRGSGATAEGTPDYLSFDITIEDRISGPREMDWERFAAEIQEEHGKLG